jgi:hypothetical protein
MADNKESATSFEKNPRGQARRWHVEMKAAEENQKDWLERGDKIVKRFLDDRTGERRDGDTRVNLFTANVQTLRALLYGNTPKVDVKRRFADPGDDGARLAGEMLQRLLNTDIEKDSDTYAETLERALDDRLLAGLGVGRCRYVAEFEKKSVPAIPDAFDPMTGQVKKGAPAFEREVKSYENVDVDYVHWRDFRWSPARTWADVRWVAFRVPMTREALVARFGKSLGDRIPLTEKFDKNKNSPQDDGLKNQPWDRAEIWEIWCKEDREVIWWCRDFPEILDTKPDTLELDGFFPVARPLFANLTTTRLIPTPDFTLAQDLYDEVDLVSTRITLLERAVAVRGVYDKTSPEIERLLTESGGNQLIGTDNFALFKEKGGLNAVVDWLPLEQIVGALEVLKTYRVELLNLLFQVTGMSDIMRGQSTQGATATEQALKAKFASTRVQEFQNEFARFASDIQCIKAEIISKHFDPQTILSRANARYLTNENPQALMEAVQIIKSDIYQYRIEVKPESVSMTDMAAVKQERSEFLMATATFLQSSQPIVQAAPWAGPFLLQMLQWAMAGFRGGATVEGVLDQMVVTARKAAEQAAMQPPPPDPKVEALKVKTQLDMAKSQQEMQMQAQQNAMEIERMKLEFQLAIQKANLELATLQQKAQIDTEKATTDLELKKQDAVIDAHKAEMEIRHDAKKMAMDEKAAKAKHEADEKKRGKED